MTQEPGYSDEVWRAILIDGHKKLRRMRLLFRFVPSPPRCKECSSPFRGIGGRVAGMMGFKPSPKNPNFCDFCFTSIPMGGIEMDIGVLFADVRGSTELAARLGPKAYADLLNRFYRTANAVLLQHDAFIDKMIGDEVMALFLPGFCGPEYRRIAVETAEKLQRSVHEGGDGQAWLPMGVGVHVGQAWVGSVGGEGVTDFTALGDTVNVAARLRSAAKAGEVVISEEAYREVEGTHPGLEARELDLKGVAGQFRARVLTVGVPTAG